MKLRIFLTLIVCFFASITNAAPSFWNPEGTPTPVPLKPPDVQVDAQPADYQTATPTPAVAPPVTVASPTPTPLPGLKAIDPTQAAIFSAIVPGSGQVYDGDVLRGLTFATLFGLGLWQTLDNFSLHPDPANPGEMAVKDEDLGSLFGLATLAIYGFGVQDAFNGAVNYNKKHYLTLSFGLQPIPNASLAFRF